MDKQRRQPCYLGCGPVTVASNAKQRIAISPATGRRLQRYVAKRMRGQGSLSRYGGIILEKYVGHMERVYFGHTGARACTPLDPAARDRDAVIFDMDGVLCDSEVVSRTVAAAVFRKMYDVEVTPDDFAPFTGTGEANFLRGVADKYGVDDFDVERAKQFFFELYVSGGYTLNVHAFPGVKSLISRIKDLGLKVGVASAADTVKVNANLTAIGLSRDTFDFVTSSDDIQNKKPAPDVFLAAAKGLGVAPARCTVVEDAVAGVQAALAADMRCIAVATSLDRQQLVEAGADVVRGEPAFIEVADIFEADVFAQEQTSQG